MRLPRALLLTMAVAISLSSCRYDTPFNSSNSGNNLPNISMIESSDATPCESNNGLSRLEGIYNTGVSLEMPSEIVMNVYAVRKNLRGTAHALFDENGNSIIQADPVIGITDIYVVDGMVQVAFFIEGYDNGTFAEDTRIELLAGPPGFADPPVRQSNPENGISKSMRHGRKIFRTHADLHTSCNTGPILLNAPYRAVPKGDITFIDGCGCIEDGSCDDDSRLMALEGIFETGIASDEKLDLVFKVYGLKEKNSDKASKKNSDKASKKSSDKASKKNSDKASKKSSDKASKKNSDKASKKNSDKASKKNSDKMKYKLLGDSKARFEAGVLSKVKCDENVCITGVEMVDGMLQVSFSAAPKKEWAFPSNIRLELEVKHHGTMELLMDTSCDNGPIAIGVPHDATPSGQVIFMDGCGCISDTIQSSGRGTLSD